METNNPPSLAEVLGTLNELAAAARGEDAERYRAALTVADRQGLHADQLEDAYRWDRRGRGAAAFTWRGEGIDQETSLD